MKWVALCGLLMKKLLFLYNQSQQNASRVIVRRGSPITPADGLSLCVVIFVYPYPFGDVLSLPAPAIISPIAPKKRGVGLCRMENMAVSVIALVGMLRYRHHHSLTELHQALRDRGLSMEKGPCSIRLSRYEEWVSLPPSV